MGWLLFFFYGYVGILVGWMFGIVGIILVFRCMLLFINLLICVCYGIYSIWDFYVFFVWFYVFGGIYGIFYQVRY